MATPSFRGCQLYIQIASRADLGSLRCLPVQSAGRLSLFCAPLVALCNGVKTQACAFFHPFVGYDQGIVGSKGNALGLSMPTGCQFGYGEDLALWGNLGNGALAGGHDEVVSRYWVPLDARRLESFVANAARQRGGL